MGGGSDRLRVASARLCGLADAHSQHRRLSADEAAAGIQAVLAELHREHRQGVLDEAAARYARPDGEKEWYFPGSFAVLVAAGADPDRAAEIWAARPRVKGLSGLGEDGGGKT
jgi:hypothetical protein